MASNVIHAHSDVVMVHARKTYMYFDWHYVGRFGPGVSWCVTVLPDRQCHQRYTRAFDLHLSGVVPAANR